MSVYKELSVQDSINSLEPIKHRNGLPVYADNPFVNNAQFTVNVRNNMTLVASGLEIKDRDSEEVNAGIIGRVQMVDSEQFIKLYTKNVGLIFELTLTAQKALIAVFLAVQKQAIGKASIFLPYSKAKSYYEEFGVQKIPAQSSFSAGMKTLLQKGFLALHGDGDSWYWVNPNLVFNGDRVRFINEYRVRRAEEQAKLWEEHLQSLPPLAAHPSKQPPSGELYELLKDVAEEESIMQKMLAKNEK